MNNLNLNIKFLMDFFLLFCMISDLSRIKSTTTSRRSQKTLFCPSQVPEWLAESFLQQLWWLYTSAHFKIFWVLMLSLPLLLHLQ